MRRVIGTTCVLLSLITSMHVFGQTEKSRKIVAMLIPNPRAPKTALDYDSPVTQSAYNTITSYLIAHNISVIDKYFVELALQELRDRKDIDILNASITYGQKNMADKVIWFYVTDKSASYTDKHFECTLRVISVRTGQINAIVTKEGVDVEDKEKASTNAAKIAIEQVLPQIQKIEELFTVTMIGDLNLKAQDKLDAIFGKIDGVQSFDGYSVGGNKYEYRVSYEYNIQTLRRKINQESHDIGFRLVLGEQTINSLTFYMLPKPNIHNRLRVFSALGILAAAGAGGGAAYFANTNYQKYKDARTYSDMLKFRANTKKWDKYTLYAAGGVTFSVLWYWFETKHSVKIPKIGKTNLGLYSPKSDTYGLAVRFNF